MPYCLRNWPQATMGMALAYINPIYFPLSNILLHRPLLPFPPGLNCLWPAPPPFSIPIFPSFHPPIAHWFSLEGLSFLFFPAQDDHTGQDHLDLHPSSSLPRPTLSNTERPNTDWAGSLVLNRLSYQPTRTSFKLCLVVQLSRPGPLYPQLQLSYT
jgi:hypothetical protein